jgi:hypothetical protein
MVRCPRREGSVLTRSIVTGSIALLLLLAGPALAEDFEIRGRVVDADGAGVAGIRVTTYWKLDGASPSPMRPPGWTTGEDGTFKGTVSFRGRALSILAFDAEGRRGGSGVIGEADLSEELKIVLGPTSVVTGKIVCPDLEEPIPGAHISLTPKGAIIAAGVVSSTSEFAFRLPPGEYRMTLTPKYCKTIRTTLKVPADGGEIDLGEVTATATVIARHFGKKPPELTVTEARGIGKDVKLLDFKGRWLLIEFWGYW